jgi:hypothetical protein
MENTFTVRDLGVAEQKSVQEVEQELLDKHEESIAEPEHVEVQNEPIVELPAEPVKAELEDNDVLSYIKNRYGKEVNSINDLFAEREEKKEDLPEDVAAYFKYKKETGRGIEDFVKLNRNFDDMDPDDLLVEYYSQTEEDLDRDDIQYMIEDKFAYDEEFDDPKDIKKKEIAKKKELAKAKKFFDEYKETYKTPLESKGGLVSDDEKETYNAYKKYVQDSTSQQEENLKKSQYFQKKTEELFSDEFKGFDFNVGDKTIKFLPGDVAEIKRAQSDVTNFISKYLDENGLISDHVGYHRSLAAAMNPEKVAKFFYEQGRAEALLDNTKRIKNIDMEMRNSPQSIAQSGFKVVASDGDSGRGLKIKSNRNN